MPKKRPPDKRLFIVTGLSGAGKSQALKFLEDFGFFCVDNLPIALIPQFAELLDRSDRFGQVAMGIDIREGAFLRGFSHYLAELRKKGFNHRILFLDASDEVLLKRFSETRHRHPLHGRKLLEAIQEERKTLLHIKAMADKVVDTSNLTLGELKEILSGTLELRRVEEMSLSVVSFGYKYGLPLDADLVVDVRFLPNPNYVPRLKRMSGLDRAVQNYVLEFPISRKFMRDFLSLLKYLLPLYIKEGKSYLTLAIGCTGGRHRSVFFANGIAQKLLRQGYAVKELHRDINKP